MFWKRASGARASGGSSSAPLSSTTVYVLYQTGVLSFRSDLHQSMWGAMAAFAFGALAMMIASRMQAPKSDQELRGLVHGLEIHDASDAAVYPWHKNPVILGVIVLLLAASGYGLIYLL